MSDAPNLLRAAAADIERLGIEKANLIGEVRRLTAALRLAEKPSVHEREALRAMYRRGYWAGRASVKAGHESVTNPERHARGETRRLLS